VEGRSLGGGTPPSINGTSVVFMTCNMNKRQIFLDLKSEFDQQVARKLIATCDVFVNNMRPGVVDRLGLGHDELARLNPRLISLAVSGWGEDGPLADKMATDNRVQSLAAFASINGAPGSNGEMYRHYTQIDGSSGNYITQAVLLGLLARERTGRGQRINLTMTEACLALQTSRIGEFLATGKRPPTSGSASSAIAPAEAYLCEEGGYLGIEARSEAQWQAMCRALGLEHLLEDARFLTNASRLEHRDALRDAIEAVLTTRQARWWQLKLNRAGVPNGKLMRFPELMYHPQTRDNGYMTEQDTPDWGRFFSGGLAWQFSRTPARLESAHMLGEDTPDVFDEVERLPEPAYAPGSNGANGHHEVDQSPPLAGIRVVELAQGIPGPYAGMQLADAGADVIKVEHLAGDVAREWEPRGAGGMGAAFLQLNRGKRSVSLDLASEDGRQALKALVATADVLIEDADLTRDLNIDVPSLLEGNVRLIHDRISGWGPSGPWADLPATEIGAQLASEVTLSLGKFGERPVRVGADLASTYAGIYSVQGILAALYRRHRDGLGQRIEVSLFGCLVTMRSIMWAALSNPDDWSGFHLDSYRKPPEAGFRTKDGLVTMTIGRLSDEGWEGLFRDLGFDPQRDAERMQLLRAIGNPDTSPRGWESRPLWEEAFANFTGDEVIGILERNGAGGFPMTDYANVFEHPQVKLLDVLREVKLSSGEPVTVLRSPWRLTQTPMTIERGPPLLGEHNAQVLAELHETVPGR